MNIPSTIFVNGDGGSRGNPGPAASAFTVSDGEKELHHESRFLGIATNNVAEYTCVLMALEWLVKNAQDVNEIVFRLDSELVTKQIRGEYKVRSPHLLPLYKKALSLISSLPNGIQFESVPRGENSLADKYVNEELDAALAS